MLHVMDVLKQHNNTVFEFEGYCRHEVRGRLCLEGWQWQVADDFAAAVLDTALRRLGAQRPSWREGQPQWTQEGYIFVERTRCVNCGGKIPEGNKLYCGSNCNAAAKEREYRLMASAGDLAWRLERRRVVECRNCGRPFAQYAERGPGRSFCSPSCSGKYRRSFR